MTIVTLLVYMMFRKRDQSCFVLNFNNFERIVVILSRNITKLLQNYITKKFTLLDGCCYFMLQIKKCYHMITSQYQNRAY